MSAEDDDVERTVAEGAQAARRVSVEEKVGDYPSPTFVIQGVDVMGSSGFSGQGCRIDVPTEEKLMAALQKIPG